MVERRRRRITRKSVSMFILLTFTVIYVGPILMLVFASFKSLPEFFKDPTWLPDNLEWSNYTEAWSLANFPGYMLNSVLYTVIATFLFVTMSVFVAFPIARGYVKGSKALLTLYVVALFAAGTNSTISAHSQCRWMANHWRFHIKHLV